MHWRLIDTGHLSAAENIAYDHSFLIAQAREDSIPVLRFLQFDPPAVLVGRHQVVEQEVRLPFVREHGFDVNRRITGGGTIFFDPSQIGWEIFARFDEPWVSGKIDELYKLFCEIMADSLGRLGINAHFRPRNDIEVDGRKISGTGGATEQGAFIFQGTLLVDDTVEEMLHVLRIPAEKLGKHGLESVRERVTFVATILRHTPSTDELKATIADAFSEKLGVEFLESAPNGTEQRLFNELMPKFQSREWLDAIVRPEEQQGVLTGLSVGDGGTVKAAVMANAKERKVRAMQFYGDFLISPNRAIIDLESRFKHIPARRERVKKEIELFFDENKPGLIGLTYRNFAEAAAMAVDKLYLVRQGLTFEQANRTAFIGINPEYWREFPFEKFLFPYCSKLIGCSERHDTGCSICGNCTIGEGYKLAIAAGLEPYTITSFNHLMETLARYCDEGVTGYIGSCCREFYAKHQRDFEISGVPGILLFIDSTTCYDLSQAHAAYRGEFESQTELDLDLITAILELRSMDK